MTRGEGGSRGTPEERREEALRAADVLGVLKRVCMDLGDTRLENSPDNRAAIIEVIREYRPKLVLAPYWVDLHPDHAAAGAIVRDTMYPSGMANIPASGDPYRPNEVLFYMAHLPFDPGLVVDVSGYWERKLEAIRCFASQLGGPGRAGPATNISQPDFVQRLEARARHYGSLIGKTHGEPFLSRRLIPVNDPVALYEGFEKV
jgi:bacillithiol biosynthesis deacetylase BshB1